MARSHNEIEAKLLLVYYKSPERYQKFYDRVYLLLLEIPEGGAIVIAEHCTERSMELFRDIAELCMIEERMHKTIDDALLEFSDDFSEIRRSVPFRPTVVRSHFYSHR